MKNKIAIQALILCLFLAQQGLQGSEGAGSYYFPGSTGSFAVAVPTPDGFSAVNQTFVYDASVSRAVLQGHIDANLDASAVYDYLGGLYSMKAPAIEGTFSLGALVPFGHLGLTADLSTANRTGRASADDTNIGDALFIPASGFWTKGNMHFKLAEMIFAPTGHYNVNDVVNVGRNYWGFDTGGAMTYLNMKKGLEISVAAGIEFNTINRATQYHTGDEFHGDYMINQFLSKSFGIGVQAYNYYEVTPDNGSGAKLGPFQGVSYGWGPAVFFSPKKLGGRLNMTGKWLKDVHAVNRMRGEYLTIAVAFKL